MKLVLDTFRGGRLITDSESVVAVTVAMYDPRLGIRPSDFIVEEIVLIYLAGRRLPVRIKTDPEKVLDSLEYVVRFKTDMTTVAINPRHLLSLEGDAYGDEYDRLHLYLPDDMRLEVWGQLAIESLCRATGVLSYEQLLSGLAGWRLHLGPSTI